MICWKKKNIKKYKIVKEKKGLSFNIKQWYNKSDQNRQAYLKTLNKAWQKAF